MVEGSGEDRFYWVEVLLEVTGRSQWDDGRKAVTVLAGLQK